MSEKELKKCPFCNGEADIVTITEDFCAVKCKSCRIGSYNETNKKQALEKWNKRVGDE